MTEKMITRAIAAAEAASEIVGRVWLQSNGKKMRVAYTEKEKRWEEENNVFWTVQVWEDGHPTAA